MGFYLVHADSEGRHYLAGHGLDPYSLVYTPGEQGNVDHISYVVRSAADLLIAEQRLAELGVKNERVAHSPLWRHGPALRFTNPSGPRECSDAEHRGHTKLTGALVQLDVGLLDNRGERFALLAGEV